MEKVRTGSKSSDAGQKSREITTLPEPSNWPSQSVSADCNIRLISSIYSNFELKVEDCITKNKMHVDISDQIYYYYDHNINISVFTQKIY